MLCLNTLYQFTEGNAKNQTILWKYKEFFLEVDWKTEKQVQSVFMLLRAIIKDNQYLNKSRNVKRIWSQLDKKFKNPVNQVKILELLYHLMGIEQIDDFQEKILRYIFEQDSDSDKHKKLSVDQ